METQSNQNRSESNKSKPAGVKGSAGSMTKQSKDDCIENCLDCFEACSSLIPHCLEMGGEHATKEHITMLSSCALICDTSAKMMLLGSSFHGDTCGICADICLRCAEECERIGSDDDQMKDCAEVCRRCAESCKAMTEIQ